jgi:hypothetical protein
MTSPEFNGYNDGMHQLGGTHAFAEIDNDFDIRDIITFEGIQQDKHTFQQLFALNDYATLLHYVKNFTVIEPWEKDQNDDVLHTPSQACEDALAYVHSYIESGDVVGALDYCFTQDATNVYEIGEAYSEFIQDMQYHWPENQRHILGNAQSFIGVVALACISDERFDKYDFDAIGLDVDQGLIDALKENDTEDIPHTNVDALKIIRNNRSIALETCVELLSHEISPPFTDLMKAGIIRTDCNSSQFIDTMAAKLSLQGKSSRARMLKVFGHDMLRFYSPNVTDDIALENISSDVLERRIRTAVDNNRPGTLRLLSRRIDITPLYEIKDIIMDEDSFRGRAATVLESIRQKELELAGTVVLAYDEKQTARLHWLIKTQRIMRKNDLIELVSPMVPKDALEKYL